MIRILGRENPDGICSPLNALDFGRQFLPATVFLSLQGKNIYSGISQYELRSVTWEK